MTSSRALWNPNLDEAETAEVLANGGAFARLVVGLRAGTKLALDTGDTEQVFLLARALDYASLPRTLRRLQQTEEGHALLRDRPAIDRASVDFDRLRALGDGARDLVGVASTLSVIMVWVLAISAISLVFKIVANLWRLAQPDPRPAA